MQMLDMLTWMTDTTMVLLLSNNRDYQLTGQPS